MGWVDEILMFWCQTAPLKTYLGSFHVESNWTMQFWQFVEGPGRWYLPEIMATIASGKEFAAKVGGSTQRSFSDTLSTCDGGFVVQFSENSDNVPKLRSHNQGCHMVGRV
ncbi:unnamed protein product [Calypogeia fissa]